MRQVFVTFPGESARSRVRAALEAEGLPVRGLFRGGGETVRAVRLMGGGVVVCGWRLSDMTAAQLKDDLSGLAAVVAVARGDEAAACRASGIPVVSDPFTPAELTAPVAALAADAPSPGESLLLIRAKSLLAARRGMTEPAAHRFLQRLSMSRRLPLLACARRVIRQLETEVPMPDFSALEHILIDLLRETNAKLGGAPGPVTLYYPLSSLCHILGQSLSAPQMADLLSAFPAFAQSRLGPVTVSHDSDRFSFAFTAQATDYALSTAAPDEFIPALTRLLSDPRATLESVTALFSAQPHPFIFRDMPEGSEFDRLYRFTSGPDPYVYCFHLDMLRLTVHRFLPADFEDLYGAPAPTA